MPSWALSCQILRWISLSDVNHKKGKLFELKNQFFLFYKFMITNPTVYSQICIKRSSLRNSGLIKTVYLLKEVQTEKKYIVLESFITIRQYCDVIKIGLWCLMPLSTIFQLYRNKKWISKIQIASVLEVCVCSCISEIHRRIWQLNAQLGISFFSSDGLQECLQQNV
jgi:hypothetical protein